MAKHSPVFPAYSSSDGVKLIEFGGWDMPLNFAAGIVAEHLAVRRSLGLFDVSHMGEIEIEGEEAEGFVDWLVTNNVRTMEVGQALYSPMCYPDGGVVDDLIIYRRGDARYLLVVNAGNHDKDLAWILRENPRMKADPGWAGGRLRIRDASNEIALLALQGPKAEEWLQPKVSANLAALRPFRFLDDVELFGTHALLSRTGYTGEDGFELYLPWNKAADVWTEIVRAAGSELLPCGLGARDTLRIEVRLPLYGQELSETISPLEAGLKSFVKLDAGDFCGRSVLLRQREAGPPRLLVGCEMIDKGVPRHGLPVFLSGQQIGEVTSGERSPISGAFIGLIIARAGTTPTGAEVEIDFGGRRKRARIVKTPFYKKTGGKP
ncbi:MAG TPA: glycine cleavage system aminomethyltransferase GcvT [Spirochaetia bacterium]|nr:glycine cleavage system aminomethyltransferase GcvT [Spirochaetia bacterium]